MEWPERERDKWWREWKQYCVRALNIKCVISYNDKQRSKKLFSHTLEMSNVILARNHVSHKWCTLDLTALVQISNIGGVKTVGCTPYAVRTLTWGRFIYHARYLVCAQCSMFSLALSVFGKENNSKYSTLWLFHINGFLSICHCLPLILFVFCISMRSFKWFPMPAEEQPKEECCDEMITQILHSIRKIWTALMPEIISDKCSFFYIFFLFIRRTKGTNMKLIGEKNERKCAKKTLNKYITRHGNVRFLRVDKAMLKWNSKMNDKEENCGDRVTRDRTHKMPEKKK